MGEVIKGFEQISAMKQFSTSMAELLEVVEQANNMFINENDETLVEPVSKLRETVGVIQETEVMIMRFHKGEITLDELETFRDRIAAMRSNHEL